MAKVAIAAASLAFAFAVGYSAATNRLSETIGTLRGQIEQQNLQASETLIRLTKERDQKLDEIDKALKDREIADEKAQIEINRLADELGNRPILVRVETRETGNCGGGSVREAATTADTGRAGAAQEAWVLPESNHRRLRAAIVEIETLSAAYSSCRASMLGLP